MNEFTKSEPQACRDIPVRDDYAGIEGRVRPVFLELDRQNRILTELEDALGSLEERLSALVDEEKPLPPACENEKSTAQGLFALTLCSHNDRLYKAKEFVRLLVNQLEV